MENPLTYDALLKDVKSILQKGITKAYKAVDNIKVQTYWQVGERIVREELGRKDRADYGKKIIDNLAVDLGFKRAELYRIVQFYETYPIVASLTRQLSWTHYRTLITLKKEDERRFYEVQSVIESWSIKKLKVKIKSQEYEKAKKSGKIVTKLPLQLPSPEDVFKDSYNWDFISLEEGHSEKQLEDSLLNNIQNVLLEFGSGFAFQARQQKVLINSQWNKIDLLFYHVQLNCHIIIDLKARELRQGDIEQVTKYLTYFRERKLPWHKDPIALIICKTHDKIDVYYSAGKNREDIFISEYKTQLPSEQEIKRTLSNKKF
ncbi:MAG: PDDEXK nuclease domain-containing protein [archaeon]